MTFDKIQHPSVIKVLGRIRIQRIYFNIIKAIYRNLIVKILKREEAENVYAKIRT